jgi:hypothetical protein
VVLNKFSSKGEVMNTPMTDNSPDNRTPTQNRFKLDGKTIGFGIAILVALACLVFVLPAIFGGDDNNDNDSDNNPDNEVEVPSDTDDGIEIGNLVAANSIDREGCPVDNTTTFGPSEQIYVVAPNSDVPVGTSVFARLYRENTPIEDSPPISADQDYTDTCINFVFEPTEGAAFEPGSYEVVFVVNGNESDSVNLTVQ